MRIRLLPSSAGKQSQYQALTTFLINGSLGVDGGSIGFALEPREMGCVSDIIVTHAHSDHTASLPIFIAEAFTFLKGPVRIHATGEVISALREFIFNDQIWPNFERIPLMDSSGPSLEFREIHPNVRFEVQGLRVTPVRVNHIVPTVGMLIEDEGAAVALTSDTYVTDEFWAEARKLDKLKAVYVDVSYPDELGELAAASKHLTPKLLAVELDKLDRDVAVFAVHIKPTNRDQVIRQLGELDGHKVSVAEIGRDYEW